MKSGKNYENSDTDNRASVITIICTASRENQQCGFRTRPTQTELYKHRRRLVAGNFGFSHLVLTSDISEIDRVYLVACEGLIIETVVSLTNEPRCERTGIWGFRPGLTQTGLYSHRSRLEAWNFEFKKKQDCTNWVNSIYVFVFT